MSLITDEISDSVKMSRVLFTKKILHYISRCLQFGSVFGGHPFIWNPATNRTEAGGFKQQVVWRLNMVAAIAYTFFVCVRCLQTNMDDRKSDAERIYMRVMAAYMSLALIFHATIILNRNVIPAYNNQCYELAMWLEEKHLKASAKVPTIVKLTGWTLQALYSSVNCMAVLMSMNAFLRPMSPEQPTSLLAKEPTMAIRIASGFFMGYIEYIYRSSNFAVISCGFPSCSLFLTLLSEMSYDTCRITMGSLRESAMVKFRLYQVLRLETLLFNQMLRVNLTGFKLTGTVLVVYGIYGGIRMHGIESIALGFIGGVVALFLLLAFSFLAEFNFRSNRLTQEWRIQLEKGERRGWIRKYARALTPMKITILDHGTSWTGGWC